MSPAPGARPPVALYVHVPFCLSVCPYCDFVVVAGAAARGPASRIATFVEALIVELGLRADALDARFGPPGPGRPPLESVYFGGGTPSLLAAGTIGDLLDLVDERFGLAPGAEVTLEANPGTDERGDPRALREAGVTRLSFGAQSLRSAELRALGRRHRPVDVATAVAAARAAGTGSINLDLLYDLPGQSLADWIETLEAALALRPDHLSLYALTLDDPDAEGLTGPTGDHLPVTSGARAWRERARPGQDEDRAAAQYHYAASLLAEDGWHGYEISNWARPGHESRHNLAYWERRPYEAVGPGAHAFDGVVRRWNAARLEDYLGALLPAPGGTPALPPGGQERLDPATAAAEELILGLRTDRGVGREALLGARSGSATLDWALAGGLVEPVTPSDEVAVTARIRLTTRGRLLSNELFSRLL